eukprot:TRINITY_DN224_c1_g1_i4.p1 TRINITY_DN224_c1_g1~~TRINITY_DN224_c1_g1_i4.p1  ORF type:complete len:595 (+),score=109.23 TRINITY_DN224_c1_g1_i4:72-1787(+)
MRWHDAAGCCGTLLGGRLGPGIQHQCRGPAPGCAALCSPRRQGPDAHADWAPRSPSPPGLRSSGAPSQREAAAQTIGTHLQEGTQPGCAASAAESELRQRLGLLQAEAAAALRRENRLRAELAAARRQCVLLQESARRETPAVSRGGSSGCRSAAEAEEPHRQRAPSTALEQRGPAQQPELHIDARDEFYSAAMCSLRRQLAQMLAFEPHPSRLFKRAPRAVPQGAGAVALALVPQVAPVCSKGGAPSAAPGPVAAGALLDAERRRRDEICAGALGALRQRLARISAFEPHPMRAFTRLPQVVLWSCGVGSGTCGFRRRMPQPAERRGAGAPEPPGRSPSRRGERGESAAGATAAAPRVASTPRTRGHPDGPCVCAVQQRPVELRQPRAEERARTVTPNFCFNIDAIGIRLAQWAPAAWAPMGRKATHLVLRVYRNWISCWTFANNFAFRMQADDRHLALHPSIATEYGPPVRAKYDFKRLRDEVMQVRPWSGHVARLLRRIDMVLCIFEQHTIALRDLNWEVSQTADRLSITRRATRRVLSRAEARAVTGPCCHCYCSRCDIVVNCSGSR